MEFCGHFGFMLIMTKTRWPNLAEFEYDDVGHISERTQLHWFLLPFDDLIVPPITIYLVR